MFFEFNLRLININKIVMIDNCPAGKKDDEHFISIYLDGLSQPITEEYFDLKDFYEADCTIRDLLKRKKLLLELG